MIFPLTKLLILARIIALKAVKSYFSDENCMIFRHFFLRNKGKREKKQDKRRGGLCK